MSYDKKPQRNEAERYAAQTENARREEKAALSGVTLGILFAVAIAAAAGTFFFLNRREVVTPVIVPSVTPSVPASPAPEKQTIIREETVREVPVPQQTTQPPDINIVVPSPSAIAPEPQKPSSQISPSPQEQAPETKAQDPASAPALP